MGSRDVTPAADGAIWFCGPRNGKLGRLDPRDGVHRLIDLGPNAAPHGVVLGPDGAPWVTEGGQNAIARVDPADHAVRLFRLPEKRANANLDTGVFVHSGTYWFTGQNGIYGRLDPRFGQMDVFDAPRGRGPYGMTLTPKGEVWYASLAGNHIARIDLQTGAAAVVEPPTRNQGARRVWSDSKGRLWVSEWNSGNVSVHDPADGSWRQWKLPGERPRAYSVYVDDRDIVWLTDFSANAIVRFDPVSERFHAFPSDQPGAKCPADGWAAGAGLGRRIRHQPLGGDRDAAGRMSRPGRSSPARWCWWARRPPRHGRTTPAKRYSRPAAPAIRSNRRRSRCRGLTLWASSAARWAATRSSTTRPRSGRPRPKARSGRRRGSMPSWPIPRPPIPDCGCRCGASPTPSTGRRSPASLPTRKRAKDGP